MYDVKDDHNENKVHVAKKYKRKEKYGDGNSSQRCQYTAHIFSNIFSEIHCSIIYNEFRDKFGGQKDGAHVNLETSKLENFTVSYFDIVEIIVTHFVHRLMLFSLLETKLIEN